MLIELPSTAAHISCLFLRCPSRMPKTWLKCVRPSPDMPARGSFVSRIGSPISMPNLQVVEYYTLDFCFRIIWPPETKFWSAFNRTDVGPTPWHKPALSRSRDRSVSLIYIDFKLCTAEQVTIRTWSLQAVTSGITSYSTCSIRIFILHNLLRWLFSSTWLSMRLLWTILKLFLANPSYQRYTWSHYS